MNTLSIEQRKEYQRLLHGSGGMRQNLLKVRLIDVQQKAASLKALRPILSYKLKALETAAKEARMSGDMEKLSQINEDLDILIDQHYIRVG